MTRSLRAKILERLAREFEPALRCSGICCLMFTVLKFAFRDAANRPPVHNPSFLNRLFTSLKWKSSEQSFSSSPFLKCSATAGSARRSEEHTSELQSLRHLVCRLL